ncbi:PAS domain S-box protein [Desulfovibrio sp. TomC]|uniref:PAS domain S-box protein n=1 Tax=Desulfovibrio sp. TomC TaxID=1562888 RepID=UPI000575963C|nr:PAS domain S-box protein [Desulfovibrio sp. TomC]KHK03364.1 sensory box histidine kinase/response regulator [Desulfovibrio sp. TomC]
MTLPPRHTQLLRQKAAIGLAVLLLTLFAAGWFTAPDLQADSPHSPLPKTITVTLDMDYPPYVFAAPDGTYQGILIDTWKLWESLTGVPVLLRPMDWNAAQRELLQGKADVIDTIFQTPERDKHYSFSPAYARIEVPVFVHNDLSGINNLETLRGFTVGVKHGDASVDYLSSRGILPLVAFDGYEGVIQAARDAKIKVFCVDKPPALYYLYKYGLESEFRLAFTLYHGDFHRAVRKGNEALLRLVEDGFSRISPEQYAAIDQKWRGATLFPSQAMRYSLWALAAVVSIAVILLAFNAVLRRTVRRQLHKLNQLRTAVGQSEERHRELVQSAASVILRLDPLGRVTFCNAFGLHFFGYGLDEMLGREIGSLIDNPDNAQATPWVQKLAGLFDTPGNTGSMTLQHKLRNGELVWIAWAIRGLRAASDELAEILCIGNDITDRKRIEEALLASEERYSLVAQGANDGIWDWDLRTNIVYYSPRYMEILGHTPDEIQQLLDEWTKRIHPDDAETVIRANKRCADGEVDNFSVEYRMRHKDGSYRWILGRGASLKDEHGIVIRMAGTHTDITRRKRDEEALRESQDQLAKIFRFTPVGIAVTTRREGRLIDINETGARMLGHSKAEIIGRLSIDIGLWREQKERDDILEEMSRTGSIFGKELELRHKNGSSVIVLYSAVPNHAFGEACILSVLVNITERKAMEQTLRRSKEIAESANKAKSEFLSTMSHEIRTPMNTILGMVDVLSATQLTRDQAHALKAIELAGGALLTLLNDILDLSQIEAGGIIMEEKPCNILELAGQLVDMLRPDAARKNLTLRLETHGDLPPRLYCCPDRIRQILVNLLGNALKFTQHGEVVLEIGRQDDEKKRPKLRLAVRDTGIGIAPDKQTFIFDRFTQINASANREFGGVGLGLAICKKLTEMMGGRLRVDSVQGQGSTFTLTLPLRPAPVLPEADAAPRIAESNGVQASATVLLVEDSPTNAEVMRLMLEGTNFAITWAPSGQAALAALHDHPFDVILMDVEMPGMDGYQTTQALRLQEQDLGRPRTPVVALTAHAFEEHRQRSLEAGCDDFQVKPIPKARLLSTLETWLALRP